ncbi:ABC transporter ATP-binding protein [Blastococcus brunescens]|uniref:ABC transporter ATP-binding protein n=1 Tax=Blastococcus brunescens TaxID=1564165 RepID=A0ABZ1AWH0_9ACTN|nr:ABC transporter ATP-binding protein [Blastococcus sp. BMG 8361]WRL62286.1 ABC transporter ATP-binding protein [Blastococcus sp. BMG 8361]
MSDLKIEGLCKAFGEALAVRDLDLHIESGESIVLLGPSGCGKTTTLRMVAGFERPTSGLITIGGTVVAGPGTFVPPDQREVGVVFQSYALWPHMTVNDNVGFGLTVRRRRKTLDGGRASIAGRVQAALEQVQLDGLGKRYPHELSGGQQQRVALARALVTQPRVLLLDEPLSNLDTRLREDMRLAIRNIQRESGVTMIYITHDRTEALALADRIVALKTGETQQIGPPEQLYQNPRNRFVALSLGPANFIPATVQSWGTRSSSAWRPVRSSGSTRLRTSSARPATRSWSASARPTSASSAGGRTPRQPVAPSGRRCSSATRRTTSSTSTASRTPSASSSAPCARWTGARG